LDPSIPIYAGIDTKLFVEAQEKTSPRTNYRPHDYRKFRTGDRFVVGDIEVKPILS
jgi:hypothetical protein